MSLTKRQAEAYIAKTPTVLFATVDEAGKPDVRVLGGFFTDGSDFYFTTAANAAKVGQLRRNPYATVFFENPGQNFPESYVSVTLYGKAQEVTDAEVFASAAKRINEKIPYLKIDPDTFAVFKVETDYFKVYDTAVEGNITILPVQETK